MNKKDAYNALKKHLDDKKSEVERANQNSLHLESRVKEYENLLECLEILRQAASVETKKRNPRPPTLFDIEPDY